ncbi:hypothetical protein BpHYR1_012644 [Brachionus plicatilis]|uniref:Uncharacterized protein n=1 Tax=Brachionus plicatilis TaxID=10195 RepID=A0A3M7SV42_BRAPC|nr:hypothetical protein BpHYR1_012644 [Brachionus plicatilis]
MLKQDIKNKVGKPEKRRQILKSFPQTQRFQLSERYVLNDLNSQLQSRPRPQALVQNTRPRPQPVVNNTDSQENTALQKFN